MIKSIDKKNGFHESFLTKDSDQWLVMAILLAAVSYQAVLCFMNTHLVHTSRTSIGIAELIIYLSCIPILARRLLPGVLILALMSAAILCLLMLISGNVDAKSFRDLAIPLIFFWLGCNLGRPDVADRALKWIIIVVVIFGLIEAFFLNLYTDIFDIFSYYISTGNLQPITDYVRESKLQLNGIRPEGIGRTLLPSLLGSHRVSSIFLEPVSLGNFAAVCAAWGLSRDRKDLRSALFFLGAAIILIILSDSRFALMAVSLMIAVRLMIHGKALNLTILAPLVAIGLVLLIGLTTHEDVGDNFRGRLAWSGWALMNFDLPMLMGANNINAFADHGWAHVLSTFGLPLCILLWVSFWILELPDEPGLRFRAFISIYIALILCISGFSLFALKSAGILWFLLGTTLRNPALMIGVRYFSSTQTNSSAQGLGTEISKGKSYAS